MLKKNEAISISKSHPNIWKKLYVKEFHNMRTIKKYTFKILRKYVEINQLLINLNIEEVINNNMDITLNDLNELEKTIYADKSLIIPFPKRRKSTSNYTSLKSQNNEMKNKNRRRFSVSLYSSQRSPKNNPLDFKFVRKPDKFIQKIEKKNENYMMKRNNRIEKHKNSFDLKDIETKNNYKNITKEEKLNKFKDFINNLQKKIKEKEKNLEIKNDNLYKGSHKYIKRNSSFSQQK